MSDDPYVQPESSVLNASGTGSWAVRLIKLLFALVICCVLVLLFVPVFRRGSGDMARRVHCKNNLKQIGLALHNYHDDYGSFPPAYTVDESGQPLHSWRTLILPYLDQSKLYSRIDLAKPWNDPVNEQAKVTHVPAFQCPSASAESNHTTYFALNGEGLAFHNSDSRTIRDFSDGTSSTVMVAEVPSMFSVPWMSPKDADALLLARIRELEQQSHQGGLQALMGDGSARYVSTTMSKSLVDAALTLDGQDDASGF